MRRVPPLAFSGHALLPHLPPPPWSPSCTSLSPPSPRPLLTPRTRKALKVVDLKDILAKASVAVTGKANKPDLIAKILASPDAVAVYNQLHGGGAAELSQGASPAPPAATAKSAPVRRPLLLLFSRSTFASRRARATATQTVRLPPCPPSPCTLSRAHRPVKSTSSSPAKAAPAPSPPKPASQAAPKAVSLTPLFNTHNCRNSRTRHAQPDASAAVAKPTEAPPAPAENEEAAAKDDEAEKRKARAARFGIPVVENPADAEAERRKARAERFGIAVVEPKAAPTAGPKGKRGPVKGKGKGAQPAAAGEVRITL